MVQRTSSRDWQSVMKDTPISIDGKPGEVKDIGHSLKDVDAIEGWQWAHVGIYDGSKSHTMYRYFEGLPLMV